jgi:hypothetical protein
MSDFDPSDNPAHVQLRVRLSLPVGEIVETGELFAMKNDPSLIDFVHDSTQCEHKTTVCMSCASSWATDHEVMGVMVDGRELPTPLVKELFG